MNLKQYVKRVNDELTGVESEDISLILKTLIGVDTEVDVSIGDLSSGSIAEYNGPKTFRNSSNKIIRVTIQTYMNEVIFESGRLYHGDEIRFAPHGVPTYINGEMWDTQPILVISFDDKSFTPESAVVMHGLQNEVSVPSMNIVGKTIVVDLGARFTDDHVFLFSVVGSEE